MHRLLKISFVPNWARVDGGTGAEGPGGDSTSIPRATPVTRGQRGRGGPGSSRRTMDVGPEQVEVSFEQVPTVYASACTPRTSVVHWTSTGSLCPSHRVTLFIDPLRPPWTLVPNECQSATIKENVLLCRPSRFCGTVLGLGPRLDFFVLSRRTRVCAVSGSTVSTPSRTVAAEGVRAETTGPVGGVGVSRSGGRQREANLTLHPPRRVTLRALPSSREFRGAPEPFSETNDLLQLERTFYPPG